MNILEYKTVINMYKKEHVRVTDIRMEVKLDPASVSEVRERQDYRGQARPLWERGIQ